MKGKRFAVCGIGVALLCVSAASGKSLQEQSSVRFRTVHDKMIVVSLMAGTQGPFSFLFDTGADTTIVDSSLAGKLSLVPIRPHQQTTLSGVQSVTISSLSTVSVGRAQVDDLPVLIQDLSSLRKLDPWIVGVVGQNFLSHFNYLLDYREHLLRFEQGDEIRSSMEGDKLPASGSNHRMIVDAEMRSAGRMPLRLLLDSGANSLVLMRQASRALSPAVQTKRAEATVGGVCEVRVGTISTLTVGSQQFHDVVAALPALESPEGIGDGLLPMAFFDVLYVNNREGYVVFHPRAVGK